MTTQYLKELIEAGHDIQLKYHGKTYWITWSEALGIILSIFTKRTRVTRSVLKTPMS